MRVADETDACTEGRKAPVRFRPRKNVAPLFRMQGGCVGKRDIVFDVQQRQIAEILGVLLRQVGLRPADGVPAVDVEVIKRYLVNRSAVMVPFDDGHAPVTDERNAFVRRWSIAYDVPQAIHAVNSKAVNHLECPLEGRKIRMNVRNNSDPHGPFHVRFENLRKFAILTKEIAYAIP
jgi:hypothetical protein